MFLQAALWCKTSDRGLFVKLAAKGALFEVLLGPEGLFEEQTFQDEVIVQAHVMYADHW